VSKRPMAYAIVQPQRVSEQNELEQLVGILGVPFHQVTLEGAVDRIEAMVDERGVHYVVTPNVDFLVKARRDPALWRVLVNADLVLCDGKPIVWASMRSSRRWTTTRS
jgi:N-acetylglucosaminyldiphosphoundecaprenol N-acetyl-beta-D-mannosaminyltransferase